MYNCAVAMACCRTPNRLPSRAISGNALVLVSFLNLQACWEQLTLVDKDAEMPYVWKRVHLDKILVFVLQLLPQILQFGSSKLPVATLGRLPVVSCHCEQFLSRGPSFEGSVCSHVSRWRGFIQECCRTRVKEAWEITQVCAFCSFFRVRIYMG